MNKIKYALLGMAAAVFAGCADLSYNEASSRDEDWTYNSPLNGVKALMYSAEFYPDEAEPSMFNYTLGVLARVSQAIRGRVLLPPLYALIDQSMHNADWRHRHAVMYTLCQVGEIVTDDTQRRQIAQYVITSFQDAHPRVRYASVRCLGQLATDFQPFLQHELSVSALTAIFSLLHADQPVRVRFITAAALINFVDGAEPAILQPVLGDMLHALLGALPASPILVQKQVSAFSLSFITL